MRSKASIKSHPLHPILVSFPVAFFSGTFLFDLLAMITGKSVFWQTGQYMEIAGIVGAVLAAVPGVIDYVYTVPPASSAKKRATKHGILNVSMLLVFVSAFFIRDNEPSVLILAMEALGMILLSFAGWLGGTLVYRNQIGVDPRYANAGKWREIYVKERTGMVEVATGDELQVNQMKLVHLHDKRIVLARTEDGYRAFDDRCSHRGGSLAGGALICGTVQCPWHGSQFNTETGEVQAGPASARINVYVTTVNDGKVFLHYDG